MDMSSYLVIVVLGYYTRYLIKIFFGKNKRKEIKATNTELQKLRSIPVKSVEEQKRFLELKEPMRKKPKRKLTLTERFKLIGITFIKIVGHIILFIVILSMYLWIFAKLNINVKLWQAMLFVVLFPLAFNYVLGKFNLQTNDLATLLKFK